MMLISVGERITAGTCNPAIGTCLEPGFGQPGGGQATQADIPALTLYYGAQDPASGARNVDLQVEAITIAIHAWTMRRANEPLRQNLSGTRSPLVHGPSAWARVNADANPSRWSAMLA